MEASLFVWLADWLRRLLGQFLDPFWTDTVMVFVRINALLGLISTAAVVFVWMERRVAAFMQLRSGPNRVGPLGLLQSVADSIKLLGKEDIRPAAVDRKVWALAPVLLFVPALAAYAVIPFDNGVIYADLSVGVLYFIAVSSQATLPFLMAGWASNNKYSLLGGMRTVAQMVSYEIPLVFSLTGVIMLAGSLRLSEIVAAQSDVWYIVLQPLAFVIYIIAAAAETNRAPFDLAEAESELVAGPFTEYSGMRWSLFFMAEYANLLAVSAIAAGLFLGGWQGPWLPGWLWFGLKTLAMVYLFMWFRWTFPRLRPDQLMQLGWKVLLPAALVNMLATGLGISLAGMMS
ncbi:MAG: NADH-quinone oxidoreductase subunit NuoH [Sporomusaceae bacterium]|nr:NADH-quinone oxidoreductase subunit NuoH [Sporomusaceae bacterium]